MMELPLSRLARRASYGVAQTARMSWYTAHYLAARQLAGPATPPGEVPRPYKSRRPADGAMRRGLTNLVRREAEDIEAGVYKVPRALREPVDPARVLRRSRRFFEETRRIANRAFSEGGATEVREMGRDDVPSYYSQNFHFQSDGYFTDESAKIYDTQVEALFTGTADVMRRRALPFLLKEIESVRAFGDRPLIADVGCGTGRLLGDLLDNTRHLEAIAVDLSDAYLDVAKRHVDRHKVRFLKAPAEALPLADGSLDVVYSVYLFHELPPKVRREVAAEFARVLKPGGLYVHVDSAQYGDGDLDILLEGFPRAVHEPYYESYCREDLSDLFGEAGFVLEGEEVAFLSKVSAFRLAGTIA